MLPAAKRGLHTNGLSPPNGRSTPVIRKLGDELCIASSSRDLAVADISPRERDFSLREVDLDRAYYSAIENGKDDSGDPRSASDDPSRACRRGEHRARGLGSARSWRQDQ